MLDQWCTTSARGPHPVRDESLCRRRCTTRKVIFLSPDIQFNLTVGTIRRKGVKRVNDTHVTEASCWNVTYR